MERALASVQVPSESGSLARCPVVGADPRVLLLTEVDFKWLMAGQGCWVNTHRFHVDPAYAAELLRVAASSPCAAVRECALRLRSLAQGIQKGDWAH